MNIINYSDNEAKDIISKLLNKNIKITPIGNHELKRHLVYSVKSEDEIIGVFKIYYKKNRWNREVASLKFLDGSGIKAPKILSLGKLEDGTEWLFMKYMEGEIFEKIFLWSLEKMLMLLLKNCLINI